MSAIHPLVSRPPYALAYLGYQVSARQMMDPILFQKLVMNNFCKCHSLLNKRFLVFNLGVLFFLLSFVWKAKGGQIPIFLMQEIKPSVCTNSISDMFSGTIPVKLLLQLATTFQPGGLRNREGKVIYKDRLRSCKVPVLAIAGDQDLICPPLSVTGEIPHVLFFMG